MARVRAWGIKHETYIKADYGRRIRSIRLAVSERKFRSS